MSKNRARLRLRPELEDVQPELVGGPDPHVVRDHVEHPAHAALEQPRDHSPVCRLVADLGVDPAVVEDVVAVRAARPGMEEGGEVAVGDPQVGQVIDDPDDVVEPEALVELEPVGGPGAAERGSRPRADLGLEQRIGDLLGRRGGRPGQDFRERGGRLGRDCGCHGRPLGLYRYNTRVRRSPGPRPRAQVGGDSGAPLTARPSATIEHESHESKMGAPRRRRTAHSDAPLSVANPGPSRKPSKTDRSVFAGYRKIG